MVAVTAALPIALGFSMLPVHADSGIVKGGFLPSGCNYQASPAGGCILVMLTDYRGPGREVLAVQPLRRNQELTVVKVYRNGGLLKKRTTRGGAVNIPYCSGRYLAKALANGETTATKQFRVTQE